MVVQGGVLYSWVYILNPNTSTYLARRWLVFFGGVGLDFYDNSVICTVVSCWKPHIQPTSLKTPRHRAVEGNLADPRRCPHCIAKNLTV